MKILITGLILILFSIFSRKYSAYVGFMFVLIVMGLQSGVKGDYDGYHDYFDAVRLGSKFAHGKVEVGWEFLNSLFSFASFPTFLFVLSLIQFFILSRFVRKYVNGGYQYMAAVLFFFTFSFMLLQMKAIRQGFAVELCLAAFMYCDDKKYTFSILMASLAFFIHNSCIILFPILCLFYLRKIYCRNNTRPLSYSKSLPSVITLIYLAFFLFKKTILNGFLYPLRTSNSILRFAGYFEDIQYQFDISWLIVLYDAIMIFTVTWYYKYASSSLKYYSIISIIAAFSDMLLFGLGALSRIFMYLSIFNIVVYPNVAKTLKSKYGTQFYLSYSVLCVAYAFKTSLPWALEKTNNAFGTYKFIFE
jgi:hypothetical protein